MWVAAGSGAQLEKVFKAAVSFLEEGSQDARTYGKRIIWQVSHNAQTCITCSMRDQLLINNTNVADQ